MKWIALAVISTLAAMGCGGASTWEAHAKAALVARAAVESAQEVTKQAHHDALSDVIAANASAGAAAAEAAARDESKRWEPLYDGTNFIADATNAYVAAVVTALELEEQGVEGVWAPAMDAARHLARAWANAGKLAAELGADDFPKPPALLLRIVDAEAGEPNA